MDNVVYFDCQESDYQIAYNSYLIDLTHPQKHGPYYQLSYVRKGKSTSRFIRPPFVKDIERQLKNYKKFKQLTQAWLGLAIQHATLKLDNLRKIDSK